MVRTHGTLLGTLLLVAGIFVGYGVKETFAGVLLAENSGLPLVVAGLTMSGSDLAIRRFWGVGAAFERYLVPSNGPKLSLAPCWLVGLGIALLGALLASA